MLQITSDEDDHRLRLRHLSPIRYVALKKRDEI